MTCRLGLQAIHLGRVTTQISLISWFWAVCGQQERVRFLRIPRSPWLHRHLNSDDDTDWWWWWWLIHTYSHLWTYSLHQSILTCIFPHLFIMNFLSFSIQQFTSSFLGTKVENLNENEIQDSSNTFLYDHCHTAIWNRYHYCFLFILIINYIQTFLPYLLYQYLYHGSCADISIKSIIYIARISMAQENMFGKYP